ncbi:hypothetical protein DMB66_22190 [Actinoplanes sp. ATCC 53533]|nr:hypothetical protein DMB66_22190 [Actinoplanes sp. ATCC 53533]
MAGEPAARIRVISSCSTLTRWPAARPLAAISSRSSPRSASTCPSTFVSGGTESLRISSAAPIRTTQTAVSSTAKRMALSLPASSTTSAATGARPTPAQINTVRRRAFCGASGSRSDMVADATESGSRHEKRPDAGHHPGGARRPELLSRWPADDQPVISRRSAGDQPAG